MTPESPERPRPRVSVLVAAYNARSFLAVTLGSALAQTYRDLEVLVIDDGSRDGTAGVVREFERADPRVRLITQANRGLSATRNRGIAESRGDLIAFLDHDDLWHPEKLARQVACLDATGAGVVSCYSEIIDSDHRCTGWQLGGDANGRVYEEMLEWDMVSGGSVVLVRRSVLDTAGAFDEALHVREDWDMWIRLARRTRFATVPQVLVGYTRRPSNESRDSERMAEEGRRVIEKAVREDPSLSPARCRFYLARDMVAITSFCTIDGQTADAWRYLAQSIRITPRPLLQSPKRWALVVALVLQSVLPAPVYRRVVWLASATMGRARAGQPFASLGQA